MDDGPLVALGCGILALGFVSGIICTLAMLGIFHWIYH